MVGEVNMPAEPANDSALLAEGNAVSHVENSTIEPFSVQSRGEAEYLLALDHSNGHSNPEWTAFLVESLVGYLVWQNLPWGQVTEDDADWLIGLVADAPSPSVPALVFALVREVNEAPERLIALALRFGENRMPELKARRASA